MNIELLLAYIGASFILTIMPGPDNIYVLTESLTSGKKNGVAVSTGLASGVLIHTTFAALGISLIIQESVLAFSIIKYLGAAYLFYLAIQAYFEEKQTVEIKQSENRHEKSFGKLYRTGFLMNVLNPKVSLFFVAFLPQFVDKDGISTILQMMILGIIFMINTIVIFSSIAVLAGHFNQYLNKSRFWNIVKWSKMVVLSVLALTLALSTN